MRVIPFEERYRQDFIDMNRAWISEMFHKVEGQDEKEFKNIDVYLKKAGRSLLPSMIMTGQWPSA